MVSVIETENSPGCCGRTPMPLVPRNGSFDWIRVANDYHSRNQRQCMAKETSEAVDQGWYWYCNDQVQLPSATKAETSTAVVSHSCGLWPPLPPRGRASTEVKRAEGTVLSVALELTGQDKKVAAISAASAHKVGGGFMSGGRHALEESICAQSTLYRCLRHAWRQSGVPEGSAYIPPDGAVLSPNVEVFRAGTSSGYGAFAEPIELACVVSVAMPNLNGKVRDAPVEKVGNQVSYRSSLCARWRAALLASFSAGATDVVCPDAGCGVYGNDPAVVGAALGETLRSEFWGHIKNVWLVGSAEFCSAVEVGVAAGKPRESTFGKLKGQLLERVGATGTANARRSLGESDATECISPSKSSSRLRYPWQMKLKSWSAKSTTASTGDSDAQSSIADTDLASLQPGNEDGKRTPPTNQFGSQSNAKLTDELLRRHLESLLKNDASFNDLPNDCNDQPQPPAALTCSGGMISTQIAAVFGEPSDEECDASSGEERDLQAEVDVSSFDEPAITVRGVSLAIGSDRCHVNQTVSATSDASVLRSEFARLKLCSDEVRVML